MRYIISFYIFGIHVLILDSCENIYEIRQVFVNFTQFLTIFAESFMSNLEQDEEFKKKTKCSR